MTPSQAAIILGVAAAFDRRTVGEADARAWADALNDVDPDTAVDAVKDHYAHSRDFIYPSDIRAIVKRIHRDRIDAGPNIHLLEPPEWVTELEGDEHTAALLRWEQESRQRIRRGLPVEQGTPPAVVPAGVERVRAITASLAESLRAPGTRKREPA